MNIWELNARRMYSGVLTPPARDLPEIRKRSERWLTLPDHARFLGEEVLGEQLAHAAALSAGDVPPLLVTLDQIAERITPCPPPDVMAGCDLCPCGAGATWPCRLTEAAWLARGLDRTEEIRKAMREARAELGDQAAP